jgi:hypothetical protein
MFLKPDTLGIIPRWGYRMEDRQSFEALQWLPYIGRTRKCYSGREWEVHLTRVQT